MTTGVLPYGDEPGFRPRWDPIVRAEQGCDCPECRAALGLSARPPTKKAIAKAESLLRRYLTPEQRTEWELHQKLTLRGSDGSLFVITPRRAPSHNAVLREDGLGISVWPVGMAIAADWALSMKLYLEHDEHRVVGSGRMCASSAKKSASFASSSIAVLTLFSASL